MSLSHHTSPRPISSLPRHDWTHEEVRDLFALPFPELIFRSAQVHRENFDPTEVRLIFAAPAFVLFALIIGPFVIRFRRRYLRRKKGLCSACGCDLRVSKDKCPECGAGIPAR